MRGLGCRCTWIVAGLYRNKPRVFVGVPMDVKIKDHLVKVRISDPEMCPKPGDEMAVLWGNNSSPMVVRPKQAHSFVPFYNNICIVKAESSSKFPVALDSFSRVH